MYGENNIQGTGLAALVEWGEVVRAGIEESR